nr:MAG TPA: hypothetical protein [Caudoviricetes sp.]
MCLFNKSHLFTTIEQMRFIEHLQSIKGWKPGMASPFFICGKSRLCR